MTRGRTVSIDSITYRTAAPCVEERIPFVQHHNKMRFALFIPFAHCNMFQVIFNMLENMHGSIGLYFLVLEAYKCKYVRIKCHSQHGFTTSGGCCSEAFPKFLGGRA
jgi:hypothetical protein